MMVVIRIMTRMKTTMMMMRMSLRLKNGFRHKQKLAFTVEQE